MTQSFYSTYPLRDGAPCEAWRAERVDGFWAFKRQARQGDQEPWVTRSIGGEADRVANDWLTWDLDELADECRETGISVADGLELQVPFREGQTELRWDRSFGFSSAT
jgi:hypothetical protein